jgi:hypothetical protein
MAIDLPPVMPPQIASQIQIQALADTNPAAITASIAGIQVRVIGNEHLSNEQISQLLATAATPSAAITALTRLYYNTGHLLVRVSYFRIDDTVTVFVEQARVKGLRGDNQVLAHFASLIGDNDLSLDEFDRARVLADMQAQRAGLNYSVSYEQHYDNEVILEFREREQDNYDSREFIAELNNKGSRFLGRYFGLAGFKQRFSTGTELSLGYSTSFEQFGEVVDGDQYQQVDLQVDHPFSFGLYGLELAHVEYERKSRPVVAEDSAVFCLPLLIACAVSTAGKVVNLNANIDTVAMTGEQLLRSNPVRRWSVFERVEWVDSEIEASSQAEPVLGESYATFALGAKYSRRGALLGNPSYLKAQIAMKKGVGNKGSFNTASPDDVTVGARSAEFIMLEPKLGYKFTLAKNYVLALNFNGQFTDDTQLPQQQQFVLGGINSLSAYLPGVLIGDNGYFFHTAINAKHKVWGMKLESSIFAEYGATSFNANGPLGDYQGVADAGLRVQLQPGYGLESELIAALPVMDDVADDRQLKALEADFYWRLRWVF